MRWANDIHREEGGPTEEHVQGHDRILLQTSSSLASHNKQWGPFFCPSLTLLVQGRVLEPLLPVNIPVENSNDDGSQRREDDVEERHVDVAVHVLPAEGREGIEDK